MRWGGFARQVAPLIHDLYASTPVDRANRSVLDLCCGTGQLAVYFLEKGYNVVGIDLSEHMLAHARENAKRFVEAGQARFLQCDAADFTLGERFGLVVSTYDSLNHLDGVEALRDCFESVFSVCDGFLIFDLNTKAGLSRWNGMQVDDTEEMVMIVHRLYDSKDEKGWTKITGFIRGQGGLYERFDETASNTVFDLDQVKDALLQIGWAEVYFARVQDLTTPIAEPEKEGRVFVVASRERTDRI
jgi:SAM-dependent methyltransferase